MVRAYGSAMFKIGLLNSLQHELREMSPVVDMTSQVPNLIIARSKFKAKDNLFNATTILALMIQSEK